MIRLFGALLLLLLAAGCTDWDAKGGSTTSVQTTGPSGYLGDASGQGDGSLQHWDTWEPPLADAVSTPDAATADTGPVYDWDALPADATPALADAGPADVPQVYSFDGKGDFVGWPDLPPPPPDVQPDVQADDAFDAFDGAEDATAAGDTGDTGDDASDGTDLDAVEPADAVTADDAQIVDAAQPDGVVDATQPDDTAINGDAYQPGGGCPGAFACPCSLDSDCESGSCANLGGGTLQCTVACANSQSCPSGLTCSEVLNASGDPWMVCLLITADAGPADTVDDAADAVGDSTTDLPDVVEDSLPTDVVSDTLSDAVADLSSEDQNAADATLLPDGAAAPDWQGYGDISYPDGADIYGGAVGSCLSMYMLQIDTCGDTHPSAACIDGVVGDGSLYAQAMFQPLQQCEKAACIDLCATATDKTCMEQCITKYCAPQFFACTSNAAIGASSCSDAWKCAQDYPGKFLTISAKCYAATSAVGQQQFSSVISCVSQPQSTSCVPEIATCFGANAAGIENCGATSSCMGACNGDQYCSWSCLGKASPQAVALVDAMWTCSLQKCKPKCNGAEPCQTDCLKSDCQQQLVKCLVN